MEKWFVPLLVIAVVATIAVTWITGFCFSSYVDPNEIFIYGMAILFGFGLAGCGLWWLFDSMNNVSEKSQASHYASHRIILTGEYEHFTHQTRTRRRIEREDSKK